MSQENVEVCASGFEAWNAGDMDALRDLLDPDVIMRMPEGWPEPGPYVARCRHARVAAAPRNVGCRLVRVRSAISWISETEFS